MTTFLLIRHAAHDLLGRELSGRREGVALSQAGLADAEALAARLAERPISEIHSSPLERARQTAAPIARRLGPPVRVEPALTEIAFGPWSGQAFAALDGRADWTRWNRLRSLARPPEGETMLEVQARILGFMEARRLAAPEATIALVSHGDVVKAAIAHLLGVPIDLFQRIAIDPASVSTVVLTEAEIRLQSLNVTG